MICFWYTVLQILTRVDLCNHHCSQDTEHSITPQKLPVLPLCSQFLLNLNPDNSSLIAIILPFLECHKWNLTVCFLLRWFFSPSIMPLRFIHVVCINTSFLFYFKLSVYIFLLSLDEQFKHG